MLPRRLGRDIDIREVRAVADLARAEEWDDICSAVVPSLQEKNGLVKHVAQDIEHVAHDIKQVRLSPVVLIGLAGIVALGVVLAKRRISSVV